MNSSLWTVDKLLNWNNIVIIGWLALIFAPFHRLSKYFVLLPALMLSTSNTFILFHTLFSRNSNSSLLNLPHSSECLTVLGDPFIVMRITNYFCVMDLWVGRWMAYDFYSGYSFGYSITEDSNGKYHVNRSWSFGRIVFTVILLTTYILPPF